MKLLKSPNPTMQRSDVFAAQGTFKSIVYKPTLHTFTLPHIRQGGKGL